MVKALGSSEEAVFLQHRLDDMNQRWSDLKAKSASIRSENLQLLSAVLMSEKCIRSSEQWIIFYWRNKVWLKCQVAVCVAALINGWDTLESSLLHHIPKERKWQKWKVKNASLPVDIKTNKDSTPQKKAQAKSKVVNCPLAEFNSKDSDSFVVAAAAAVGPNAVHKGSMTSDWCNLERYPKVVRVLSFGCCFIRF